MQASIIDMTLRLPVDETLFEELQVEFLPKASQHPGFCGFQYVLGGQGHAIGILWYEQPTAARRRMSRGTRAGIEQLRCRG